LVSSVSFFGTTTSIPNTHPNAIPAQFKKVYDFVPGGMARRTCFGGLRWWMFRRAWVKPTGTEAVFHEGFIGPAVGWMDGRLPELWKRPTKILMFEVMPGLHDHSNLPI
jgi:hypothetical protein